MTDSLDHPFYDVVADAREQALKGHKTFQKFTCGNCGSRQTIAEPNKFYTAGKCEECGWTTDIEAAGCNFMMVMSVG